MSFEPSGCLHLPLSLNCKGGDTGRSPHSSAPRNRYFCSGQILGEESINPHAQRWMATFMTLGPMRTSRMDAESVNWPEEVTTTLCAGLECCSSGTSRKGY